MRYKIFLFIITLFLIRISHPFYARENISQKDSSVNTESHVKKIDNKKGKIDKIFHKKDSNLNLLESNLFYMDGEFFPSAWMGLGVSIQSGYERMLLSQYFVKFSTGFDIYYQWNRFIEEEINNEAFRLYNKNRITRVYIRFTFDPYRFRQNYLYPILTKFNGWYLGFAYGYYKTKIYYEKNYDHEEYPPAQGDIGSGKTIYGHLFGIDIGWRRKINLNNLYIYAAFTLMVPYPKDRYVDIFYTTEQENSTQTKILRGSFSYSLRLLYFGMGYMF